MLSLYGVEKKSVKYKKHYLGYQLSGKYMMHGITNEIINVYIDKLSEPKRVK